MLLRNEFSEIAPFLFYTGVVVAQSLDYISTLLVIDFGGFEANPIMQSIVSDPLLFFIVKMGAVVLMGLCIKYCIHYEWHPHEVACGLCCISILPAINNIAWVTIYIDVAHLL